MSSAPEIAPARGKWISASLCLLLLILWGVSVRWQYNQLFVLGHSCVTTGLSAGKLFLQQESGPRWTFSIVYNPKGGSSAWSTRPGPTQRTDFGIEWPQHVVQYTATSEFEYEDTSVWRVVTVPLWIPFLALVLFTAFLFWRDRRRRHRVKTGHCLVCGYNLTGQTSNRCSECGTPIDASPTLPRRRKKYGLALGGLFLVIAATIFLIGARWHFSRPAYSCRAADVTWTHGGQPNRVTCQIVDADGKPIPHATANFWLETIQENEKMRTVLPSVKANGTIDAPGTVSIELGSVTCCRVCANPISIPKGIPCQQCHCTNPVESNAKYRFELLGIDLISTTDESPQPVRVLQINVSDVPSYLLGARPLPVIQGLNIKIVLRKGVSL